MRFALNINNVTKKYAEEADVWILDIPNRMSLEEVREKYNIEKAIEDANNRKVELIIRNVRYEDKPVILELSSKNVFFAAASIADAELLIEENISNVFCALPITDGVTFDYLTNTLKMPKVVVAGYLAFNLSNLNRRDDLDIMVNPAHVYGEKGDLKSFFIRPEDIDLYEEIINTVFFTPKSLSYEEVLFDVYKKRKVWYGNLQDIVINLKEPFYNQYLFNDSKINFGEMRLICKKKCFSFGAVGCRYCDDVLVLQNLVQNKEKELKEGADKDGKKG